MGLEEMRRQLLARKPEVILSGAQGVLEAETQRDINKVVHFADEGRLVARILQRAGATDAQMCEMERFLVSLMVMQIEQIRTSGEKRALETLDILRRELDRRENKDGR